MKTMRHPGNYFFKLLLEQSLNIIHPVGASSMLQETYHCQIIHGWHQVIAHLLSVTNSAPLLNTPVIYTAYLRCIGWNHATILCIAGNRYG